MRGIFFFLGNHYRIMIGNRVGNKDGRVLEGRGCHRTGAKVIKDMDTKAPPRLGLCVNVLIGDGQKITL